MSACHVCLLVCLFDLWFLWNKVGVRQKYRHLCVKEAVPPDTFIGPVYVRDGSGLPKLRSRSQSLRLVGGTGWNGLAFWIKKICLFVFFHAANYFVVLFSTSSFGGLKIDCFFSRSEKWIVCILALNACTQSMIMLALINVCFNNRWKHWGNVEQVGKTRRAVAFSQHCVKSFSFSKAFMRLCSGKVSPAVHDSLQYRHPQNPHLS